MAKFDFNSSRYAKFFASKTNRDFLQTFINTSGILGVNYGWWRTQCRKAEAPTPIADDGTATFTQKSRRLQAAPLMDMRAPLGKGNQEDSEGISFYTASIPDFISTVSHENALERMRKQKEFELFGNDADIVIAWTQKLQDKLDQADQTMNWMTAKLETTGQINYTGIGRGIQIPLHKAAIPTANFSTAGTAAWASASAKILSQMAAIETKYRNAWGYNGALVWLFNKNLYQNVFLKNQEVKDLVSSYRQLNYLANTADMPVTDKSFRQAFVDYVGVSPIEIVEETERNITNSGESLVSGWDDKYAVLRPAGPCCDVRYKNPIDQYVFSNYGSNAVEKVFARANDGLCTIINSTINNGELKEWATEVIMSAVPALNEFEQHVIVDTTTAD
jgi:hypothetical protein